MQLYISLNSFNNGSRNFADFESKLLRFEQAFFSVFFRHYPQGRIYVALELLTLLHLCHGHSQIKQIRLGYFEIKMGCRFKDKTPRNSKKFATLKKNSLLDSNLIKRIHIKKQYQINFF